jgi:hypothetical protein
LLTKGSSTSNEAHRIFSRAFWPESALEKLKRSQWRENGFVAGQS